MSTRIASLGFAVVALLAVPSLAAAHDVEPPASLHDSAVRIAVEQLTINQSVDQAGSTLSRRRSQARTWSGVGLIALGFFMPIQKETCVSFVDLAWHRKLAEREPKVYAAIDNTGIVHGPGMKSYRSARLAWQTHHS